MNLEEFSFLSIFLERFNLFPFYAHLPVLLNARLEVIDVLCSRSDEQLLTFKIHSDGFRAKTVIVDKSI